MQLPTPIPPGYIPAGVDRRPDYGDVLEMIARRDLSKPQYSIRIYNVETGELLTTILDSFNQDRWVWVNPHG